MTRDRVAEGNRHSTAADIARMTKVFPKDTGPASVTVYLDNTTRELHLEAAVHDRDVRDRVDPSFDGMERPFAYLPDPTSGAFVRKYLAYSGTAPGSGVAPDTDFYELVLKPGAYDLAHAMLHGVAVGLETNVGDVWLQSSGDDYPVK
jgi:hypothetical protein